MFWVLSFYEWPKRKPFSYSSPTGFLEVIKVTGRKHSDSGAWRIWPEIQKSWKTKRYLHQYLRTESREWLQILHGCNLWVSKSIMGITITRILKDAPSISSKLGLTFVTGHTIYIELLMCLILGFYPGSCSYLLNSNNKNTRKRREICSNITIKTPERRQWRLCGVSIVNSEHILLLSSISIVQFEQVNFSWIK